MHNHGHHYGRWGLIFLLAYNAGRVLHLVRSLGFWLFLASVSFVVAAGAAFAMPPWNLLMFPASALPVFMLFFLVARKQRP